MAVAVLNEVEGVTPELYDAVNAKLGDEIPDGGIIHTAGFTQGKMIVFDVWESRERFERFQQERLRPAILEVGGENAPTPTQIVYELHHLQSAA
jgi:hypothetical protein